MSTDVPRLIVVSAATWNTLPSCEEEVNARSSIDFGTSRYRGTSTYVLPMYTTIQLFAAIQSSEYIFPNNFSKMYLTEKALKTN